LRAERASGLATKRVPTPLPSKMSRPQILPFCVIIAI
jgi:hypothetical protein